MLRVTRPQASTTRVTEVSENENTVIGKVESPSGITRVYHSFCHGAVRFFEMDLSAWGTSRKRDLSLSHVIIGLVNKKNRVVLLPPTTPTLMADVNEQWQTAVKPVCMVYEILFQMLLEAVDQSGEDIREGVHAVICDPS